ncbi:MAG: HigA family addiction module antitoxin [Spirochaetaceae bacterium]|nr:HigA family addiction module antitoxin [Spirochaetaceae bacterium]
MQLATRPVVAFLVQHCHNLLQESHSSELELGGLPLTADNDIKVNMTPSHPGDFIRTEVIEELGLSVTRAAEILGVRRATLSDLLNRRAALSPEMALRIEKAFDVGMDLLLRMQAWYDAAQMRSRSSEINVQRYKSA